MRAKLTQREQQALTWARSNYRDWRQRFSRSLPEHVAAQPEWVTAEIWRSWYAQPFGNPRMNAHVRIVRQLLQEGRV